MLKKGSFFVVLSALMVGLTLPFTLSETTGHATTLTPTAADLHHSETYYQAHAEELADRYGLSYKSQTALLPNETTKVYVASKNIQVKKSVQLAMNYWNQKLGHKVFVGGTQSNHTLTVTMTGKNTSADAWWKPAQHQLSLEKTDYTKQLPTIRNKMIKQTTASAVKTLNKRVKAYGHKIANKANFAHDYNLYRADQLSQVKKKITLQKRTIVSQKIDVKARTFEYANIVAHEMGHSLGLQHSTNAGDAMAANSSTPNIYNYDKVKTSKNGFNILDKTDINRAKLALAIHDAQH
ncbi:matrixin family metalloprotease [Lactobacillus sp. LC28-10]|uniref:Matrixin family metalloprotease n=1 Tax=Secundilactobacillus angelensis TaxID=2722706 RepID=A0ABX1KY45_9LACO|nr:matrixin family metalloprotease [Secundilactobacillus angelensis]MCH5462464.1 matrixin family metalloprotease [Secundilactobacillus angelensis]NLR18054.1 matrixin family metalloprotease [Secundilactobacillus angelensis]